MSATQHLYEALGEVSRRMVEAARANDWDRLAALDAEMTAAREAIARSEPHGSDVDDAELVHRARLIAGILEDHREVRRHVDPWMASASRLLGGSRRDRAVRAAYGMPQR